MGLLVLYQVCKPFDFFPAHHLVRHGVCLVLCFTALGGFFFGNLEWQRDSGHGDPAHYDPHGVLRHPAGFRLRGPVYVDARQRTLWPKLKQKHRDLRAEASWK